MNNVINYLKELKRIYLYLIILLLVIIIIVIVYFLFNQKPIVKKVLIKQKEKVNEQIIEKVKVDIKGAINNPGVYELDKNSRVIDAINVAGGMLEDADTSAINLSKVLTDEMTIIIYTKKQIAEYQEKNKKIEYVYIEVPSCPDQINDACITDKKQNSNESNVDGHNLISLNVATKEQLMTLSGIGESKADDIIKYRDSNGGFKSIEDVQNVKGIGKTLFEKIKDNIII